MHIFNISDNDCGSFAHIVNGPKRGRQLGRLWGWWYVCIGIGFILLGLRYLIAGITGWPVALRWAIGAGFLLLAFGTLRSKR